MEYKYKIKLYKGKSLIGTREVEVKGGRYSTMFKAYQIATAMTPTYDFFEIEETNKAKKYSKIINVEGWSDFFPSIKTSYEDAECMIVGTVPSDGGIKAGVYYGSSRNGLWEILDEIYPHNNFSEQLKEDKYNNNFDKIATKLKDIHLIFGDTLISCKRPESDSDDLHIISARHTAKHEFEKILIKHKNLNKIICNSQEAFFRFLIIMNIEFDWLKLGDIKSCELCYNFKGRKIIITRAYTPSGRYFNLNKKKVIEDWKQKLK